MCTSGYSVSLSSIIQVIHFVILLLNCVRSEYLENKKKKTKKNVQLKCVIFNISINTN